MHISDRSQDKKKLSCESSPTLPHQQEHNHGFRAYPGRGDQRSKFQTLGGVGWVSIDSKTSKSPGY